MQSSFKILIIRFSSLGDIVLTTPVFRELKKIYPQSHLTFLTSYEFGSVVANNPYIDQAIYHSRQESRQELNQLVNSLKKQSYDVIYDIHRSLRSRWICWNLKNTLFTKGPKIWRINKQGWERTLLIQLKINLLNKNFSQRERFLKPLQHRVSYSLNPKTELFPTDEQKNTIERLLEENHVPAKKFICIGPSASFPGKCWPVAYFQTLISELLEHKWKIILVGGKDEEEPKKLKEYFTNAVFDLSGKLNPLESAALLSRASFVVCNDTSIGHLAEAMGTPAITIFGPTVREFGYAPFLPKSVLVEKDLPCRPCTRNGKGECKISETRLCLTSISPTMVKEEILKLTSSD
ncbi:MAG: glycosyltransferase family 9 protein [SAR324 cluster bacterium]|nr:glycosyltransferase family 9 protein [SAR324 cluster bacterium]